MRRPAGLIAKIKAADIEVKNYVIELEKENLRLHEQLGKLRVQNVYQQNEIKTLTTAKTTEIKFTGWKSPDNSRSE